MESDKPGMIDRAAGKLVHVPTLAVLRGRYQC